MFEGRNQLIQRLASQIGSEKAAITILKKRGHLDEAGNLTPEGKKRDAMTAAERAKDRNPNPNHLLKYDPTTNRATLIKPKLKAKKL